MSNPESSPRMDPQEVHDAMINSEQDGSDQPETTPQEKVDNNMSDEDVENINDQVAEL